MPPVGIKRILPYGADIALSIATPPAASAGKNFTVFSPIASAVSTSLGVAHPGNTGIFIASAASTIFGWKPGVTTNCAPAFAASCSCPIVNTVPAPHSTDGQFSRILRIASAAASVRKVISAQGKPPFDSAFAIGTASSALSIVTTGRIPSSQILASMGVSSLFIVVPSLFKPQEGK